MYAIRPNIRGNLTICPKECFPCSILLFILQRSVFKHWTVQEETMAIITEEPEQEPQQPIQKPKTNPTNTTKPQNNTNPFTFWFYFTLSVSLVTLIFSLLLSGPEAMVSQLAKLSSSSLLFWSDHQGPDEPESITHRAFHFPKRRQID